MAKSDNLLAILWMLRSRKRMTAAQIAEELEVDVRTVYRYIDALCMSGAPIIAEPGPSGGYGLLDSFRDTPLFFSTAERIALAHAGLFARHAGYPYSSGLTSALAKVERHLSPEQLEHLNLHASGLDVIDSQVQAEAAAESGNAVRRRGGLEPGRRSAALEQRLRVIEEAAAESRRLEISHFRELVGPPLARRVDPYGLIFWRDHWYLIGYCHLRRDIRTFRCDRIASVEATGEGFRKPPDFSPREYFLRMLLPREAARAGVTIRVRGTPYALESLAEHWFLANFIADRSEDEIGLAVDVELASDYLPYFVLQMASELTIVEPEELRNLVAKLARRLAADHESSPERA